MVQRSIGFVFIGLAVAFALAAVAMHFARPQGPFTMEEAPALVLRQLAPTLLALLAGLSLTAGLALVMSARGEAAAQPVAAPAPRAGKGEGKGIGRLGPWVLILGGLFIAIAYPWLYRRQMPQAIAPGPDSALFEQAFRWGYRLAVGQVWAIALVMIGLGVWLLGKARRAGPGARR
jgi:hypothetical protein